MAERYYRNSGKIGATSIILFAFGKQGVWEVVGYKVSGTWLFVLWGAECFLTYLFSWAIGGMISLEPYSEEQSAWFQKSSPIYVHGLRAEDEETFMFNISNGKKWSEALYRDENAVGQCHELEIRSLKGVNYGYVTMKRVMRWSNAQGEKKTELIKRVFQYLYIPFTMVEALYNLPTTAQSIEAERREKEKTEEEYYE